MSNVMRGKCLFPGCQCKFWCPKSDGCICQCGHVDAWHANYGDVRILQQFPGVLAMFSDLRIASNCSPTISQTWQDEVENRARCVVCLDRCSNVVLLPCRHANVCAECSDRLISQALPRCPTCRTLIRRRVRYINTNTI